MDVGSSSIAAKHLRRSCSNKLSNSEQIQQINSQYLVLTLAILAPNPENGQTLKTIHLQQPTNYLSAFDHLVGLARKGLNILNIFTSKSLYYFPLGIMHLFNFWWFFEQYSEHERHDDNLE